MRLTLRTLLAWLDDTLPPAEVRQIGHQVAESPFAQELVERIHRVARQRRLTVPNSGGSEATDPNIVAAYLDNELSADHVAEFEKRCLTSDVHLAEVASVHQILSLIGQKAKVPPEARHRMYRMIKGREAVRTKSARAYSPPRPDPLTEPLVPWAPPEPPRRSWVERYGPAGIVVLLILILCWSTWLSLNPANAPQTSQSSVALVPVAADRKGAGAATTKHEQDGQPAQQEPRPNISSAAPGNAAKGGSSTPGSEPSTAQKGGTADKSKDEPPSNDATKKGSSSPTALPAGAIGLTESSDAILFRFNPGERVWERLKDQTPVKENDRLVGLDHYRNSVRLGSVPVVLVGLSEIRPHIPEKGNAAEFDLVRGRVVVRGVKPAAPIIVKASGQVLKMTPPADALVGLELPEPGAQTSDLKIYSADGEVPLAVGETTETLSGPSMVVFQAPDKFAQKEKRDPPSWVTDVTSPPLDKQIGEQFARAFKSDHEVIKSLLEAMEDEQKDVRQMAITSLGALGEVGVGLVVSALATPNDAVKRRAAVRTLRVLIAQGGETGKMVHDELEQTLGKDEADQVSKLLAGFTPKEAREEVTYTKLVLLLSNPDPGIRELALDNLETLTGRDDLGYNADNPDGAGLKSWQELLRRRELRPQAPPAPK
ncbi:MAG TPA: HEAT repeat domain-containing protein [Isosphaeraceae bacterium]|jgi:hypothetical protein|nr:HEAT repeat domain-containing protein [Isosphaeraceae bacterium]